MISARERELEAYLVELAKSGHLSWLESDDVGLFSFYGLGIMPTSAQEEMWADILAWPDGAVHLWRVANRGGKTTALVVFNMWACWKKWRYSAPDAATARSYAGYKTLHTAPLNKLMGKAWELADGILAGGTDQQRDPLTSLQRKAWIAPLFKAGSSKNKANVDELWVKCANGAKVDFLSTQGGAGRMESDTWWVICWDEFIRQAPISDVMVLFQQTFLPRSSDHMAPLVLSSTSTEDGDYVYLELEELAERERKDFNLKSFGRDTNFSQSKASIARQIRLSPDREFAARSVGGEVGEGGRGKPFPPFLLENAFRADLADEVPAKRVRDGLKRVTTFDHAIKVDDNVALTLGVPWPPTFENLLRDPVQGLDASFRRSSRSLTPDEMWAFAKGRCDTYRSEVLIIDGTAQGGHMVYMTAASAGYPAVSCNLTSRIGGPRSRVTAKEYGIQALQRLLAYGLPVEIDPDTGWVREWPEPKGRFGLLRLPATGNWNRVRRQLAVYTRDDAHLRQDAAVALVMFAWWLYRLLASAQMNRETQFSMLKGRERLQARVQGGAGLR